MSRPFVAVAAYRLGPGRVTGWRSGAFAVPATYTDALRRAGIEFAVLCPEEAPEDGLLRRFDGLLLLGGGDVDPGAYGASPHPEVYGVDRSRDSFEIALVREAAFLEKPTLAICRGAQVLNVAFGGTLVQHLPDLPGTLPHGIPGAGRGSMHEVKVAESSRLSVAVGQSALDCVSHHHQAIDDLGQGLVPVAWSGDGVVEGVERDRGWMLGVQWHPEDSAGDDPSQQALFEALARQAAA